MSKNTSVKIKRALLSVSDKSGITELAKSLENGGVEIISTGGTLKHLADAGIKVKEVSDFTGSPEMMEGRVKTLHPKIHAGILSRREKDLDEVKENFIEEIDLVVINLYPFEETVKKRVSLEETIENIDIGGPTIIRAAAKNFYYVTVLSSPEDYPDFIDEFSKDNKVSYKTRSELARKAFDKISKYDLAISKYFSPNRKENFPDLIFDKYKKSVI